VGPCSIRLCGCKGSGLVHSSSKVSAFGHQSIFANPFVGGKCHIILGNDNHHMCAPMMNIIKAMEEPLSYPYTALTSLGWCAAGTTLPPVRNDPVLNLMGKKAGNKCREDF
jgi:hypothetical protein